MVINAKHLIRRRINMPMKSANLNYSSQAKEITGKLKASVVFRGITFGVFDA